MLKNYIHQTGRKVIKLKVQDYLTDVTDLPFEIKLSLEKLFKYWEEKAASDDETIALVGQKVLKKLEHADALRHPISDLTIIDQYEQEVKLLMSAVFPPALATNEIKAATLPFSSLFFNYSDRFANILLNAGADYKMIFRNLEPENMYIFSCIFILNTQFGQAIDGKRPFFIDIPDQQTGMLRHYRAFINADFMEFKLLNKDFKLSEEDICLLLDNFEKPELWKEKIPPSTFEMSGFSLLTIFDVTPDEVLADLKTQLLESDALHEKNIIESISSKLQVLLNIPELKFGFAFIDEQDLKINSLKNNYSNSIILHEQDEIEISDGFCDYATNTIFGDHTIVAISNVEKASQQVAVYRRLYDQGIESYIAAPILYNGNVIGLFELGAPKRNQLNSIVVNKLQDVLPLFTLAMQRNVEEYQTKLELIVQENYTAIHPSVSWRFFEAAENLLKTQQLMDTEQVEDIQFENVYPLYGQSDIKGSSTERNLAIQEDLVHQLTLAVGVLKKASKLQPMPIFNQLLYQLNTYIGRLQDGLNAGDEVNILDFLKLEVYPVFDHLRLVNPKLKKAIEQYTDHLDPDLGVVYERRKEYEQSVHLINEKLSDYIDKQQALAQQMFPHYFEKYKTDGVEFNIYIGQSLVKNRTFNLLHLHNLRLWQLLTICGVENVMHQLKPKLKTSLDVASLILVHSSPLSITFRMDEKRFDVDGAYNVRYEITKKRIDKAYIKGTNERLTQPGKIAIVYSQNKDAEEYRKYIDYLQSIGMLGEEIENLELQELQGASGLRALRVTVNYDKAFVKKAGALLSKAVTLDS